MAEKETENIENFTRLRILKEDTRTGELYGELGMDEYYVAKKVTPARKHLTRCKKPYVWVIYQAATHLLETLPKKHVAMLFYLATYFGYEGYLTTGKKPIRKTQLPQLLDVGKTTAYRFWTNIVEAGIAREDEQGPLHLNKQFFDRGQLRRKRLATMASQNVYVTRLYITSIRDLYKNATPTSRSALSYLFQVLPFVSREYNVVCRNPLEQDLDEVVPMKLEELCDAIGYDKANASRLLSELMRLKFTVGSKETWAVGYVATGRLSDRRQRELFINPAVYYAGRDWEAVKVLGKF